MDILKKIVSNKLKEIKAAKKKVPLESLKSKIKNSGRTRDFKGAISKKGRLCIIAEIKKASPSAGIIRKSFDPVHLAVRLEKAGADALSVLTDRKFFKGDLSYIKKIKAKVRLPILRKDFIVDEYQVYESRANGADAILLIAGLLPAAKLRKFYSLSKRLKMGCIIEAHSRADLKKALKLNPDIIGFNNRNLKDFSVDLNVTLDLSSSVPKGKILVSESGIRNFKDTNFLKRRGINAALIGEAFMRMKAFSVKLK